MLRLLDTPPGTSERTAIIERGRRATYGELAAMSSRFAEEFADAGIRAGSVTVLASDYTIPAIAAFLALAEIGAVVVPVPPGHAEEIQRRIAVSRATHSLAASGDGFTATPVDAHDNPHELMSTLIERNHAGLVLFSSGSTGEPKGMLHDLTNLINAYVGRPVRDFSLMVFLTFDHIGGIDSLLRTLSAKAALVIPEERTPEHVARLIESERVSVLPASPTFLNLMLLKGVHESFDLSSLDIIGFGAEPMPEHLLHRLIEAFPGVRFQQKFGTSETNAIRVTSPDPGDLFMHIDDDNIEYRVVDGELWLRSETRIVGYLNAPMDAFTEDGWFRTGDLVETRDDGAIRIIGRSKEVINVGGEKVLPGEVEAALASMPEIEDCVVYGQANPITGQSVAADVVLAPGIDPAGIRRLVRRHCKDTLAPHKIPAKVFVVPAIDTGARFKKIRRKPQPE